MKKATEVLQAAVPGPEKTPVYLVCSDGPCGLNMFDAFASETDAKEESARLNETRKGWDATYVWTVQVRK